MNEAFFQNVWQYKLFGALDLQTTDGEIVEVINQGQHNKDAGPDFFNAQVKIGDTLWAGNVEIHTKSAMWYRHGHDKNHSYDNVILHVVGESDGRTIYNANGLIIPEVVLRYPTYLELRYQEFMNTTSPIRCHNYIERVSEMELNGWIDRLLVERFEQRNRRVEQLFETFNGDWNQVCFCLLARSLGGSINGEAMEMLARCTPVKILFKHNTSLQKEALLYGQSGLLPQSSDDEYVCSLISEYRFLKNKFSLNGMDGQMWKFMRLRPSSFPLIRISQLSAVVSLARGNFESVFRSVDINSLLKLLDVSASEYWDTHYTFGKESLHTSHKFIGKDTRRLMIINAIVPFAFAYTSRYGKEQERLNVMRMLSFLPIEKNNIIETWINCGIVPKDEGEAQALLLLRKEYCDKGNCLSCRLGHIVMTKAK